MTVTCGFWAQCDCTQVSMASFLSSEEKKLSVYLTDLAPEKQAEDCPLMVSFVCTDHNATDCPRQARDGPRAARLPPRPARLPDRPPFRWAPSGAPAAPRRRLGQFASRLVPSEARVHLAAGPSRGSRSWHLAVLSTRRRTRRTPGTVPRVVLGLSVQRVRAPWGPLPGRARSRPHSVGHAC